MPRSTLCARKRTLAESNRIRELARKYALASPVPRQCVHCGYATHVEVCHIKPVSEFPVSVPARQINADTNITYLCPNHHWELDNGHIAKVPSLADVMARPGRLRLISTSV